jgi:hypothetical protein
MIREVDIGVVREIVYSTFHVQDHAGMGAIPLSIRLVLAG